MANPALSGQPLNQQGAFNWIFLIEFITNGILVLFFLFYFNRVFAWILSYAIRLISWQIFRVQIEIQSLQISLLAGRIFFKGVRYHGDNETFFVQSGYITWRYWLYKVRDCEIFQDEVEGGACTPTHSNDTSEKKDHDSKNINKAERAGKNATRKLPCRISADVTGFEAFIYNRSPAYDIIIDNIAKREAARKESNGSGTGPKASQANGVELSDVDTTTNTSHALRQVDTVDSEAVGLKSGRPKKSAPPFFLKILPIHVKCKVGAAVLGNENTQAIITAKFDAVSGEFDATHAGELDIFKILMDFEVTHPVIQMKPNVDFRRPQLAEATTLRNNDEKPFDALQDANKSKKSKFWVKTETPKPRRMQNFLRLPLFRRKSTDSILATEKTGYDHRGPYDDHTFLSAQERWRGLARYLDDTQQDQRQEWEGVEYARTSTLADITSVNFKFFWDIPGTVPESSDAGVSQHVKTRKDINGSQPPDYGMEIYVRGGLVNYGPWADRHRVILQQLFFPMSYTDSVPESILKPGQTRLATLFNLFLQIEAETTVRIPFREPSKDWRWKGRASTIGGAKKNANVKDKKSQKASKKKDVRGTGTDTRPFAWFDLKVKADTTVSYTMDMYCGRNGYENLLNVDVSALEIFSSLNHGLLLRSERLTIHADLSNPISWNSVREWPFDINIQQLDLFLLRDHTFLLVDLIEDWSVGPQPEFYTFVPYRYLMKLHLQNFKLYLNTNDANIIDSPEDLDDNDFVILYGRTLDGDLTVPIDQFRPRNSDITFNVAAHDLGFEVSLPPRNTVSALLVDKNVAQLPHVYLSGVYTNCSEVQSGLTETLNITMEGQSLVLKFFGFFGRQLVKIKENYFGDHVNFRTLEEYQDIVRRRNDGETFTTPPMKSNDLDVILDIKARDVNILLPASLYNCDEHIRLRVDTANIDLRVSNYYLELMVNSSPAEFSFTKRFVRGNSWVSETSSTQLFIDGVKCYGHRLFGLPPSEPSYVDNWDVNVGDITGECSSAFLEILVATGRSIAVSALDSENASSIDLLPTAHDTTFVRFRCSSTRIWVLVDDFAFCSRTGEIGGSFTDYAGKIFSQKLRMNVPDLAVFCINSHNALRQPVDDRYAVRPLAYLGTSINFTMVQRSQDFDLNRRLQQEHIIINDARTHRVPFLIHEQLKRSGKFSASKHDNDPVSLPLPILPPPLRADSFRRSIEKALYDASSEHLAFRPPATHKTEPNTGIHHATKKAKRSSIILSSPYKPLALSLDVVELDLSDVPKLQDIKSSVESAELDRPDPAFLSRFHEDDILHMSFMINAEPGISAFCDAEAVLAIGALIEKILPKDPERILDSFQIDAYGEVLNAFSQKTGQNQSLNFSLRVPQFNARFVNTSDPSVTKAGAISDQYDLNVINLITVARMKTLPQRPNESNSNFLHTTIGSVRVAAQESSRQARKDDVALESFIDDILIWIADSDRTSIHASFRDAKAALASRKIEYLARLIHRTTMMADRFNNRFSKMSASEEFRLQSLIYHLVNIGDKFPDPLFITRPSHSLRNNSEHIRSSDTWKIVARLRYMYHCLPEEEKIGLSSTYLNPSSSLPEDAKENVLASLERWRSWDIAQVRESFAIRILYGSMTGIEKLHDRSKIPISIAVQSKGFSFLIDPGQNQTELVLNELAIGARITPPLPPSAVELFHDREDNVRMSVVHIGVHHIALKINWEICELAEHILDLFKENTPEYLKDDQVNSSQAQKLKPSLEAQKYHIVFAANTGVLRLDTINLSSDVLTESLKISGTGSQTPQDYTKMSINLALTSKMTSMDLSGHQRQILHFKVVNPSLYVAYQKLLFKNEPTNTLKIIAASRDLVFSVQDEILGLLEVASSVTTDEAAYFKRLADSHKAMTKRNATPVSKDIRKTPLKINISLFLNTYDIYVSFLNDLAYASTGHSVRLSMISINTSQPEFQMEYDLKGQSHRLLATGTREDILAELELPPINGTFNILLTQRLVTLSALVSVEHIELDGSAIYAILNTFSSSRVLSAVDSIKADVQAVQEKVISTFEISQAPKDRHSVKPKQAFLFGVAVAFAGLTISANTPRKKDSSVSSRMIYNMGSLHVKAWNRSNSSLIAFPFPEFRVVLKRMSLEIQHADKGSFRSVGALDLGAYFICAVERTTDGRPLRKFTLSIEGPHVLMYADTAPAAIEILSHLQTRIKNLDLSREKKYLRRLRHLDKPRAGHVSDGNVMKPEEHIPDSDISEIASELSFNIEGIEVSYTPEGSVKSPVSPEIEDLVLSLQNLSLIASTESGARLSIINLQLALLPKSLRDARTPRNYAVMPEIVFNVAMSSTEADRKFTFKAAGKPLDIQLDPHFILPAIDLSRSISQSKMKIDDAAAYLDFGVTAEGNLSPDRPQKRNFFGKKRLSQFLVDAQFAGAVMTLQAREERERTKSTLAALQLDSVPQHGKYGQFGGDGVASKATLQAPGISFKARYLDQIDRQASMDIEIRVDGTNNVLYPTVTPLILHIANSIKQAVRESEAELKKEGVKEADRPVVKTNEEESIIQADPSALLGKTKLNIGLRICRQELSLSCQPIAKVSANAKLEDIYMTFNSVDSAENGHFFAASAAFSGLGLSLRHVYSRETTFGFDVESITFSFMNSKHISGSSGVSAILKVNPSKMQINAKQFQDILLFREIWLPAEIRNATSNWVAENSDGPQEYFVQRYQQVAASTAFPWSASVAFMQLSADIDLGQSIGKMSFNVSNLWATSKKRTSSFQDLCIGIDSVAISGAGRMGGIVDLEKVKVRTSIAWPKEGEKVQRTPLVQGSVGFDRLLAKIAFDYQTFTTADISSFEFIMYNVRDEGGPGDRLVAILDGENVNVYCIASAASICLSMGQAFERLIQEKEAAYEESLREIEKFLRRKSSVYTARTTQLRSKSTTLSPASSKQSLKLPLSLHTDVVVTLRSVTIGAFPTTLMDHQVLRVEVSDLQARFAASLEANKIHSSLGLSLGQLGVALAVIPHQRMPKNLGEITVEDVVNNAAAGRGGVILRVPMVLATMQTWQGVDSRMIDYIFRSTFEGKIDVGWNYSRISFIRGMWETHSRTLASRLGKPLPEMAVKITGAPEAPRPEAGEEHERQPPDSSGQQQKITAVVNLPQSKYTYRALEPPIIEAPKLRDMGEATPPLEWVGLQRDRLPNVTHQIVIVTLLQIAKEVEDAYSRTLGFT